MLRASGTTPEGSCSWPRLPLDLQLLTSAPSQQSVTEESQGWLRPWDSPRAPQSCSGPQPSMSWRQNQTLHSPCLMELQAISDQVGHLFFWDPCSLLSCPHSPSGSFLRRLLPWPRPATPGPEPASEQTLRLAPPDRPHPASRSIFSSPSLAVPLALSSKPEPLSFVVLGSRIACSLGLSPELPHRRGRLFEHEPHCQVVSGCCQPSLVCPLIPQTRVEPAGGTSHTPTPR